MHKFKKKRYFFSLMLIYPPFHRPIKSFKKMRSYTKLRNLYTFTRYIQHNIWISFCISDWKPPERYMCSESKLFFFKNILSQQTLWISLPWWTNSGFWHRIKRSSVMCSVCVGLKYWNAHHFVKILNIFHMFLNFIAQSYSKVSNRLRPV